MKFSEIYKSNIKAVTSALESMWCSESDGSSKQKAYAEQLNTLIKTELFASENYVPLVQSMERYESVHSVSEAEAVRLVGKDLWDKLQPVDPEKHYPPYEHQYKAWKALLEPSVCQSMVVTTGTGSGKTECFMLPLVRDLLDHPLPQDHPHQIRAIFLYPLNALMEDQKNRIQKLLSGTDLTFAVYNGNLPENRDDDNAAEITKEKSKYPNILATRQELHQTPPDILLTNPTMLEYMLLRSKDQRLFSDGSLKWIVVDEAHTFTGAAAAELALLLRRVVNAFNDPKDIHFAASSATIGNGEDPEQERESLKKFIADISGVKPSLVKVITGHRIPYVPTEDTEFSRCKSLLTERDYLPLTELIEGEDDIESKLCRLDELCDQGLRAKVHFFFRVPNSGIRVQLDNWEDEDNGVLKLISTVPKQPEATPALEIFRCNSCGEYFAVAETTSDKPDEYRATVKGDEDLFDFNKYSYINCLYYRLFICF